MKVVYGTDAGRELETLEEDFGDDDGGWEDGDFSGDGEAGDEETETPRKSRSQKKREMKALEALGLRLAQEGEVFWEKLPLSPELRKALAEFGKIRGHGARCRHEKRIGALMREQEEACLRKISRSLEDRDGRDRRERGRMQYLESLRDRLASGDEDLAETLAATPGLDRNHFLFLVSQAVKEKGGEGVKGGRRNLFRYLKDHLPEE